MEDRREGCSSGNGVRVSEAHPFAGQVISGLLEVALQHAGSVLKGEEGKSKSRVALKLR